MRNFKNKCVNVFLLLTSPLLWKKGLAAAMESG
jgi:hypothetical protein